MLSLVVPLYKSEENIPRLLTEAVRLREQLHPEPFEIVLVNDGSPDRCEEVLQRELPSFPLDAQLVTLSRNFGAFAAIAAGLQCARGDYVAVLAADLQEPPGMVLEFFRTLKGGTADVVFGVRAKRSDPWLTEATSNLFWALYRRFVVKEMPSGGVDVFGCTRAVRDRLLELPEVTTNLIALLFWLGFRRTFLSYERQPRREGVSAWTIRKRLKYSIDSIFNFTDLPVNLLLAGGASGALLALVLAVVVLWAKLRGDIAVPGYTPTVIAIMFFGGLTTLGLGIIGQYLWLTLQNARRRPSFVIRSRLEFPARPAGDGPDGADRGDAAQAPTAKVRGRPGG